MFKSRRGGFLLLAGIYALAITGLTLIVVTATHRSIQLRSSEIVQNDRMHFALRMVESCAGKLIASSWNPLFGYSKTMTDEGYLISEYEESNGIFAQTLPIEELEDIDPQIKDVSGFVHLSKWNDFNGEWGTDLQYAFALEDISLSSSVELAQSTIPIKTINKKTTFEASLDPFQYPSIPDGDPLPFLPEASPCLVPLLTNIRLQIGFFALGRSPSQEKTIKLRFYASGELYNPYDSNLKIHGFRSSKPTLLLEFKNLPKVKLVNQSLGVASDWIDLNETRNATNSNKGINCWIHLPPYLDETESHTFEEPLPDKQPEGLARDVLKNFIVRPSDRIRIEFKKSPNPFIISLSAIKDSDKHPQIFEMEWDPLIIENLQFSNASKENFILNKSLNFRKTNCQISINILNRPEHRWVDPRIQAARTTKYYTTASGSKTPGSSFMYMCQSLEGCSCLPEGIEQKPKVCFSWPLRAPRSMMNYADFPQSFPVSFPGMNHPETPSIKWIHEIPKFNDTLSCVAQSNYGREYTFSELQLNVNNSNSEAWLTWLKTCLENNDGESSIPLHINNGKQSFDRKLILNQKDLSKMAHSLAHIKNSPISSLEVWIAEGNLANSLQKHLKITPDIARLAQRRLILSSIHKLVTKGSTVRLHLYVRSLSKKNRVLRSSIDFQFVNDRMSNESYWLQFDASDLKR